MSLGFAFQAYIRTVSTQGETKLNCLAGTSPFGTVLLASHLERLGYSRDLQQRYVRSGWLRRVGRGAFARAHEPATWRGALHALQEQAGVAAHVGGRSALGLLGRAHYLPLGGGGGAAARPPLDLFAPLGTALPRWFLDGGWDVEPRLTRTDVLPPSLALTTHGSGGPAVCVASAERAALEVLYGVPGDVSPDEARELLDGLVDLRPAVVSALLAACRSVRVKRLFLLLADRAGHPWLPRVDLRGVGLGSGKRSVAGGGVYVAAHRLAVPAGLLAGTGEGGGA